MSIQTIILSTLGEMLIILIPFLIINFLTKRFTNKKNRKRPTEITTVSILLVLQFLISVIITVTMQSPLAYLQYNYIWVFFNIASIVWVVSIWQMKKWGFVGYLITCGVNLLIGAFMRDWNMLSVYIGVYLVFVPPILINLPQYRKQ